LQGRLHLLQVRGGCTSASFFFSATPSPESGRRGVEEELEEVEEEREVARVAWWQAALSWSLFCLAGPRRRRRRGGVGRGGWRGAPGLPREVAKVKVVLPY